MFGAQTSLPPLTHCCSYAVFGRRLDELHDAYKTEGVVCWHFTTTVHRLLDAAYADLNPLLGGTVFEICGFADAIDITALMPPKAFVRMRYAKRCIVAFVRYKWRRMPRKQYVVALRQWTAFLRSNSRTDVGSSKLVAMHNSSFKVEVALPCEQARARGISVPDRVDLVILRALPNPLPPSEMLAEARGVSRTLAPTSLNLPGLPSPASAPSFQRTLKSFEKV